MCSQNVCHMEYYHTIVMYSQHARMYDPMEYYHHPALVVLPWYILHMTQNARMYVQSKWSTTIIQL